MESLVLGITLGTVSQKKARRKLLALDTLFKTALKRPALAGEGNEDFTETMYMHLTGAVYEGEQDAVVMSFDDRRTALPGATYNGGKPDFHPGMDRRTQILLENLDQIVTQNETIEYANVYELKARKGVRLGEGVTREIEFKTNCRPVGTSRIEKRLKEDRRGYGIYLLARVLAFKDLGVNLGNYRLLKREKSKAGGEVSHFLRTRSQGFPLDDIPASHYRTKDGKHEDFEVLAAVARQLGDAAAQNLAMKKYVKEDGCCRFGVGKEIFEFTFDLEWDREMPLRVEMCSVRGALGWPVFTQTEENFGKVLEFYLSRYAQVLVEFWRKHCDAVELKASKNGAGADLEAQKRDKFGDLVEDFIAGFSVKTQEMSWKYKMRDKQFDAFDPKLPANFDFKEKWAFALWALVKQEKCLDEIGEMFAKKAMEELARR
jgi:hypothetical protein